MVVALVLALLVAGAAVLLVSRRGGPTGGSGSNPEPAGEAPGRPPPSDPAARLDAFWAWWQTAGPRIAAALDAKDARSFVEELSDRIHAIDPELAWETGPGRKGARHHLSLSSEGDATLRVLIQRWLARAPAADGAWEFYPARQALQDGGGWSLTLDDAKGAQVDFASVRVEFEADEVRERVHVRLHHPAWPRLDERQRGRVALILLDQLLGEDEVERWLGGIETPAAPLAKGAPLPALRDRVAALARTATGERFAILDWRTGDGQPMLATVNLAIKRVDHLLMDDHLTVTLPLQDPTPHGLTSDEEAGTLNELEDDLVAVLGHDAVYLGRETGQGQRVLHFHVASLGPAEPRAQAWARHQTERRVVVACVNDPRWEVLRRW
jgi:hypothetical protein